MIQKSTEVLEEDRWVGEAQFPQAGSCSTTPRRLKESLYRMESQLLPNRFPMRIMCMSELAGYLLHLGNLSMEILP